MTDERIAEVYRQAVRLAVEHIEAHGTLPPLLLVREAETGRLRSYDLSEGVDRGLSRLRQGIRRGRYDAAALVEPSSEGQAADIDIQFVDGPAAAYRLDYLLDDDGEVRLLPREERPIGRSLLCKDQ